MAPEAPPRNPPRLGCTRGVEQRVLLSQPAVHAANDFREAFHEAFRRGGLGGRRRDDEVAPFDPDEFDLFAGTASDIEELTVELAAADHALYWGRQELKELREKRESARRRAYRELSDYRGWVREVATPEELEKKTLRFDGETARAPSPLVRQADAVIDWACDEEGPPPAPRDEKAVKAEWPETVGTLQQLRDELEAAVNAVTDADAALGQPLERRCLAIQSFDEKFPDCARLLENALVHVGLPTLATYVRPHLKGTGRVGRPSKRPPRDKYPDLVDAALAVRRARRREVLENLPPAPAEEAPATPPPKPRRRVVIRPFGARPLLQAPRKEGARRRKTRRRPSPSSRPLRRRRRARRDGRVLVAWPESGGPPLRFVELPRRPEREPEGRARPLPWTARALTWWQSRAPAR